MIAKTQSHLAGLLKLACLGALAVHLVGCAYVIGPQPNDPRFYPEYPAAKRQPITRDGSLYHTEYSPALFQDRTARHIGDLLTVILEEQTNATKNATTSLSKKNITQLKDPTLFGTMAEFNVPKIIPLITNKDRNLAFDIDGNRTFDGKGDASQSNKLSGSITVTVAQVLPNGYLAIKGEKWITLNQGREFIRLTGLVRQDDITPENTLSSYKIADARITYSGTGQVAETNQVGWLARFFNGATRLWPY